MGVNLADILFAPIQPIDGHFDFFDASRDASILGVKQRIAVISITPSNRILVGFFHIILCDGHIFEHTELQASLVMNQVSCGDPLPFHRACRTNTGTATGRENSGFDVTNR